MLTDTDSTCSKFLIVNSVKSNIPDKKFRDVLFEIIVEYNRFDSSHSYWEKFNTRKENLKKCLGYFEIEHIDNPCVVIIAVNHKKYYELFEDNCFNEKHKGIKKGTPGMDFQNYTRMYWLMIVIIFKGLLQIQNK